MKTAKQIEEIGLHATDLRMINYFIREKDDLTRWTGYESKKGKIEKAFPELWASLQRKKLEESLIEILLVEVCDLSEKVKEDYE